MSVIGLGTWIEWAGVVLIGAAPLLFWRRTGGSTTVVTPWERAHHTMLTLATVVALYGLVSLWLAPAGRRTLEGAIAFLIPNVAVIAVLVWLARGVRAKRRILPALAIVAIYGAGTTALAGALTLAGAYHAPALVWLLQVCILLGALYASAQLWRCHRATDVANAGDSS